MASYDDKETDRQLMSLQSQIAKNYQDAYTDIARTASTYWEDLKPRYKNEYAAYINGEHGYKDLEPAAAKAKFDAWYASQIGRGERWEKLRDDMAKRVNEANKAASALINDTTPGIYSLNANYQAYLIEAATGSADFTIYDERTVADLIQGKTQILPTTRVSGPAGEARVRDQLNKALTSGILQGQSIDKIATSFQRVTDMNRNAAIRNARTAMTNAQNAGRQDTYERAEAMGIEMEKEWIATVDDRTRDSHAELDGIRVKVDDPYPNGLMFPGDESSGDGAEYYNCRCTQRAIITKYNGEPRESVIDGHEGVHTEKTYNKWLDEKREAKMDEPPRTAADATARAMEAAEDRREAAQEQPQTGSEKNVGPENNETPRDEKYDNDGKMAFEFPEDRKRVEGMIDNLSGSEKEIWTETIQNTTYVYTSDQSHTDGYDYRTDQVIIKASSNAATSLHETMHRQDAQGYSVAIDGVVYLGPSDYLDSTITEKERKEDIDTICKMIGADGLEDPEGREKFETWAVEKSQELGDDFIMVSDIISAITGNKWEMNESTGGHTTDYWNGNTQWGTTNRSAEMWGDFAPLKGLRSNECLGMLDKIVPNHYDRLNKAYDGVFRNDNT